MNIRKNTLFFFIAAVLFIFTGCSVEGDNTVAEASPSAAASTTPLTEETAPLAPALSMVFTASDGEVRLSLSGGSDSGYSITRTDANGESIELAALDGEKEYTDSTVGESYDYVYTAEGVTTGETAEVSVKNGFFLENGYLSCYTGGEAVCDGYYNGLYFGADGVYTSGDTELDALVASAIAELTDASMTMLERFETLYDWLIDDFEYEAVRFTEMDEGWELQYAADMLESGYGNCYSFAGALTMLARGLGFEAHGVYGECHQLYEWVEHGWTEVVYEGETYLCDAEMEGEYAPIRDLDWDLFMKEYGDTPTTYEKYE